MAFALGLDLPTFPVVKYAYSQSMLKGEDVVLVTPRVDWPTDGGGVMDTQEIISANDRSDAAPRPKYEGGRLRLQGQKQADETEFGLFCVFDGHHGREAALHCREELLDILMALLPSGPMPPPQDPFASASFSQEVQKALMVAFMQLQHSFAVKGKSAGSTATVVLQAGWLLTAANVGDSSAVLDLGFRTLPLTSDHRVASSKTEQDRLKRLGLNVTNVDRSGAGPAADPAKGMGPLRIWPGGVANARVIGDLDASQGLLPSPAISQVRVPATGGRVIIASDGLWDCFESHQAPKLARRYTTLKAADHLITTTVRAQGGLRDDTSLVVLDLLPEGLDFPQACRQSRGSRSHSRKQLAAAAAAEKQAPAERDILHHPPRRRPSFACCFAPRVLEDSAAMESSQLSRSMTNPSARTWSSGGTRHGSEGTHHSHVDAVVVDQVDVADLMGLTPLSIDLRNDTAHHHPTWQDPALVQALKDTQEESVWMWQQANRNVRSGLEPAKSLGGSASLLNYFKQASSSGSPRSRRKKGLRRAHTLPVPCHTRESAALASSFASFPAEAARAAEATEIGLHRAASNSSLSRGASGSLPDIWPIQRSSPPVADARLHGGVHAIPRASIAENEADIAAAAAGVVDVRTERQRGGLKERLTAGKGKHVRLVEAG